MNTGTHYIDNGQHVLPECLRNTTIRQYTTIVDGDTYKDMDARDVDEIRDACRALGIETEVDDEGALCAVSVRADHLADQDGVEPICQDAPTSYYCVGWTDNLGPTSRPNKPDCSGFVPAETESDAEAKFRVDNDIPADCDVIVDAG
jgi:hypothetical protein